MKRTIFSFIIMAAWLIAITAAVSPPAHAQSVWRTSIDDTVKASETLASGWQVHLHPQLRIWTRATGSDSIFTNLYVQFRYSTAAGDTSERVLVDSIVAQGSRYFQVATGGNQYRLISVGMIVRNDLATPFNRLRVFSDQREYGR